MGDENECRNDRVGESSAEEEQEKLLERGTNDESDGHINHLDNDDEKNNSNNSSDDGFSEQQQQRGEESELRSEHVVEDVVGSRKSMRNHAHSHRRVEATHTQMTSAAAVTALANTVRTMFGPRALAVCIDARAQQLAGRRQRDLYTLQGGTLANAVELRHAASRVVAQTACLQAEMHGDGSTTSLLLADELIRRGVRLVHDNGLHTTTVTRGFRMSMAEARRLVETKSSISADKHVRISALAAARTALSSSMVCVVDVPQFTSIVVDAVVNTNNRLAKQKASADDARKYPLEDIHVLPIAGGDLQASHISDCYVVPRTKATLSTAAAAAARVAPARIACLNFGLPDRMRLPVGVSLASADGVGEKESALARARVAAIVRAGANVVLSSRAIGAASAQWLASGGAICASHVSLDDLNRIARSSGGAVQISMVDLNGDENLDASCVGAADEAFEDVIGSMRVLRLRRCRYMSSNTVVLRAPTAAMLDELERTVLRTVRVVKRVLESRRVVAGGGAVEAAVSARVKMFARIVSSREQLAVNEFGNGLVRVLRQLVVNCGHGFEKADAALTKLQVLHAAAARQPEKYAMCLHLGLDLERAAVRDSVRAGVVEPMDAKLSALTLATEAAVTVLHAHTELRATEP